MPKSKKGISQFWQELKRRNVVRVITVYAAAAFVVIELVDIVAPNLGLPVWTFNLVLILLLVGFVITVIVSWIYDIHPEGGMVKTEPPHKVSKEEKPSVSNSWRIASYVSFVIIAGLIVFHILSGREKPDSQVELEKTIAVLPFENMSEADEFDYFGDAMTDEIIMQLYKINSFIVRSRTSIMQYKETQKTSPVIGQELQANYLLEGSATRFEDRVRIRVQLIQAKSDNHLWGEVYEGEWKEILSLQGEIAQQVAEELKTVLSPEEIRNIEDEPTSSVEAYDYYLKGNEEHWAYWYQNDPAVIHKAIEYYLKAIELDPEYSIAYTGLGRAYWMLGHYALKPSDEYWAESKRLLEKAIELDPEDGWAYAELGVVLHNWNWDSTAARQAFETALILSPKNSNCYMHYIHLEHRIRNCAKIAELIEMYNRMQSTTIDDIHEWNFILRECRNENERMVQLGDQYFRKSDNTAFGWYYYMALIQEQQLDKAAEIAEQLFERVLDPSVKLMIKGHNSGIIGDEEGALAAVQELKYLSESRYVSNIYFANIYDALGNREQTLKYLELALEEHDWRIHAFSNSTSLNLIHYEPWLQDIFDRSWEPYYPSE